MDDKFKLGVLGFIVLLLNICLAQNSSICQKSEVQNFINNISQKHDIQREDLENILCTCKIDNKILNLMNRPAEALPWYKYQKHFIQETRIKNGIQFWAQHHKELETIENEFNIPAEYLVAIVGVETQYGKNTGNFSAVEALATLAFGYPRRASFFMKELEHLIVLAKNQKFDLSELKGSYAGALGMAQFMPSSYISYAIDYFKIGKIDLFKDPPTALASIANYLKQNGWKSDAMVCQRVPAPKEPNDKIIEFEGKSGKEYWLTDNNFYAIKRYNISNNYALAVHQLGVALKQAYDIN